MTEHDFIFFLEKFLKYKRTLFFLFILDSLLFEIIFLHDSRCKKRDLKKQKAQYFTFIVSFQNPIAVFLSSKTLKQKSRGKNKNVVFVLKF